ncbi:MATE family efflux transporter [Bradyrhizobium sp. RDM12]
MTSILSALAVMLLYGAAAPFGDDSIAAVGIAVRILMVGALPITGFCIGAQAILGFGWGARDYAHILKAAKFMLFVTIAFSGVYSAAVVIFARPLVSLFSENENVTEIAVSTCIVFHLFFGLFGVQSFVTAMLQSFGESAPQRNCVLGEAGVSLHTGRIVIPAGSGF